MLRPRSSAECSDHKVIIHGIQRSSRTILHTRTSSSQCPDHFPTHLGLPPSREMQPQVCLPLVPNPTSFVVKKSMTGIPLTLSIRWLEIDNTERPRHPGPSAAAELSA